MKIFVSVDMEGIAAVATPDQVRRGGSGYQRAQELMTAEANAAIAGAIDGGASQVVVNDSHGPMDNLLSADLDPRARVVVGRPKAQCMMQGLTPDCDAALLIGYHGAAGTRGVLAHTFCSHFYRLRLDGHEVSEADVNAIYAAGLGVPVAFLSGDDVVCQTTTRVLPHTLKLAVKTAAGWSAADSLTPHQAAHQIRAEVATSLTHLDQIDLPAFRSGMALELEFTHPSVADLAAHIPGVERLDARTIRRHLADVDELMGMVSVLIALGDAATYRPIRQ
jgi:D-amino peptidase